MSAEPGVKSEQALAIAATFANQAKRRMAMNVRRLTRNEDDEMSRLAGIIVEGGGYPWDIL
jgi:hypothetical protein